MLEDQVAFLLQKYLGNYVRGLNKEALKISVWRGDVELTNMQLRPEALNALKLPVKVKAGFLGSVKLKVPWSRLGQEPVLVYLDRIYILAEPSTSVEGCNEDGVQEAKRIRVRELEMGLLERQQQLKSEMNTSWLGSLVSTIIGNLKLSITNIHIRYEDIESNPGHPFSAGVTLARLSAVTVDDFGKETFATGGALERIQKSVELERLAFYFDSDICPWSVEKTWEELLPSEWNQIFEFGNKDGKLANVLFKEHSYILQPVTGNAKYIKLRLDEYKNKGQALQQAVVNLDNVTLCLSKDGYRDILKLADNFAAFNQRLQYAHYRPPVPVKSDPKSWWKYAYKVVTDEMKKASGKLSWEQVLRYARLRKRYVSLYASLLKSDINRLVVDDNEEIEKLDRELDTEVILQWRMLAHKFVEQSAESDLYLNKQSAKRSWWSFGWTASSKDGNEPRGFTEEDLERLHKMIGYREGSNEYLLSAQDKDLLLFYLEIHMKHNASKLISEGQECLANLSCEGLYCSLKTYSEAKFFDLKLGSYRLSSPHGLLAESATVADSLVGVFSYKPFDAQVDWSLVAKASPCYMTYLKESIDQIVAFFKSSAAISPTIALETAAAVQMTIDGVKRTAQQQVTQALKDQARFFLDLDIAGPKITIPTKFCPDNSHATRLLLDLGNLMLCTQDCWDYDSSEEKDMYMQFNLVLSDVSAFLVDGDYHWSGAPHDMASGWQNSNSILPVIEKCGIVLKLQQIQSENPSYPSTRLAIRLPSLGFHFSPARYHRLMQVAKIFQDQDSVSPDDLHPWNQADFEGWASLLTWKGVGNREAVWQRRYLCLVGPFVYILESPTSRTYKQYVSLPGKQVHQVPTELTGDVQNVLALYDAGQSNTKVVEDVNALILRFDSDESRKTWQNRLQGAIYRASGPAALTSLSEISTPTGTTRAKSFDNGITSELVNVENFFITGVLDELRICFSCSYESNQAFKKILLAKESRLCEFRAVGGQVELSIRENNIFIGTLLRSLEIEDQFCCMGMTMPRYLARSIIKKTEDTTLNNSSATRDTSHQNIMNNQLNQSDSEDNFFEASDDPNDLVDYSVQRQETEYLNAQCSIPLTKPSIKPPTFSRIPGLLPDAELQSRSSNFETTDTLDSFVKAQIVIYNQDSPQYSSVENRVMVTLATLSFFCYRPTILAILEFVNAINVVEDNYNTDEIDKSSAAILNTSVNDSVDMPEAAFVREPVVKGLLGKGKTRVIFYLTLNMARTQIFLMNENGTSLATLSQNNLLTDIKVFPCSFSIKAALGNLKISDDSLPSSHSYFWVCDMRNPGGNSFIELDFSSFSIDDDDYSGYEYSLTGQMSEIRVVYLNRFVQEVISYFMGLVPSNVESVVKLKDHATNSEKWVTTTEIQGSPALKLDLSLTRPIILMPRGTDSADYLELDVLHITVENTFQWLGGDKNEMNAVHLEIITIKVKDINLTVGTGTVSGESIIQDVEGLSLIIQRSLRDLLHQIPSTEAAIKIGMLKAALSNREYDIITECAVSNISETPHTVPPLDKGFGNSSNDAVEPLVPPASGTTELESHDRETWITMKVSVSINLVELSLHSGITRDSSLAIVQASGAWLLYQSNTCGDGFLFSTLKGFSVIDAREGTKDEFRLAIGKSGTIGYAPLHYDDYDDARHLVDSREREVSKGLGLEPIPSMLILDATFRTSSSSISLRVQRPKLLVALDFLLAIAEFFVPSVRSMLSNEDDNDPLHIFGALILDQPIYTQPIPIFSLSPQKPLFADDERFDHFIYDGKGGKLYLQDREGRDLSNPSSEATIYVGSGKRLQFKDVTIVDGEYLDSCIFLGTDSSYSASEDDHVFFERGNEDRLFEHQEESMGSLVIPKTVADGSTEFVIELQAIGPELAFYNTSKDVGDSLVLSTKVMHAHLDVFCRLVIKGDSLEMSGNILGLKVETNGIRVLEPFDTCVKFSKASGKTNIHLAVSDIFMNFSFSILRLFLAVEEDILAFLRMTSKEVSVVCSQFDQVGTIRDHKKDQICAFWRPRAPSGFAVLGDCLTPLNEPPSKGVLAVNTSFVRVKRPVSYKLIWPYNLHKSSSSRDSLSTDNDGQRSSCSIWFPVAPKGYIAVGCVVSAGSTEPPLSSALCILASLVSPCTVKDCIALGLNDLYSPKIAFWRVENSFGSFLVADPSDMSLNGKAYDLRHMVYGYSELSTKTSKSSTVRDISQNHGSAPQLERSAFLTSRHLFEAVASFRLIWWNQGTSSQKKLSIWRPVVPHGMVYLGDLAVQGYEPPNTAIVLRDTGDESFLKAPQDFQLVGHIRKQNGLESISFWLPQAPPGFVALGCVASKGSPKHEDFSSLRCIRSDMVTGDQFPEESIWDTSDTKVSTEAFSLWSVGNEVGTFLVRNGFKKPPKRFALKLADQDISSGSDSTVLDAEIKTFSAAVFDDYGGLMVPLFNISVSSIALSSHGRPDYSNSTMSFSLTARSYNDKYDAWEPLVEPMDGFLRYQYSLYAPGAGTQLRMTSTRDLNLNVSVSNANMMFQAYSSWNNLSHIHESHKKREVFSPTNSERSIINVHQKKNYYIIPQNKLGQDIYIRAAGIKRLSSIIKMPSGDNKPIKVPVSKNMMDSHLKGRPDRVSRSMVTIIIADGELPATEGVTTGQYIMAVRLFLGHPNETPLQQQSARTCGAILEHSSSFNTAVVNWSEIFFFKVDFVDSYMVEFIVIDMGRGEPIGIYSSPLKQIAHELHPSSNSFDSNYELTWRKLSSAKTMGSQSDAGDQSHGRIRCAVLLSVRPEIKDDKKEHTHSSKAGFIQISPTREGPWTTVRLNYSSPAACWRLGNDVVASEVTVKDGNRFVGIRSLVSVTNNTDFVIDLRLKSKCSSENLRSINDKNKDEDEGFDYRRFDTDEFFEMEKYTPSIGWTSSSRHMPTEGEYQGMSSVELPDGWEWVDDWHVDKTSVRTADGWIYAPDAEHLKWPESSDHINSVNYARQRRWVRHRKYMSYDEKDQISVGLLKPGQTIPLPLLGVAHPVISYVLQLRPSNANDPEEYSWSAVLEKHGQTEFSGRPEESTEICVSALTESDVLLYCSQTNGSSSKVAQGMWFCLNIQATEIGKDIHSDPIHDWNLIINSPLTIINFLPLSAEYAVIDKQPSGENITCSQGILVSGGTVKIYNADLRDPLYFSLLPQGGWQPLHDPVPISHPSRMPSKMISLKSSFSGRVVQVILEQNYEKDHLIARAIRIYVPYWITSARCPPLTYSLVDMSGRRDRRYLSVTSHSHRRSEKILWKITEEEMVGGHTIASALNFKFLGISASINRPGKERFGPVKDLSSLGDMDGSLDLYAYDADGNCIRIFVSSKPSPYQAVPTKVISIRPFMTFTNRLGQDVFIKFNSGDQPKILHASDSRVSFVYCEAEESDRLQIRLEDTNWCFPMEIINEDTITIVLRKHHGGRRFLRAEVRGYDEGSRFLVVFRLGSGHGPFRIENRIVGTIISIRQSGLGDDAWIQLEPLSTTKFSWDDPYGQRLLDVSVHREGESYIQNVSLEKTMDCSAKLRAHGIQLHVVDVGDIKIVWFADDRRKLLLGSHGKPETSLVGNRGTSSIQNKMQTNTTPLELIIELGVVGVSLIDHRPRELLYLYLEKVFISYSTGYDAGTTSRFKLILGRLQLDNQLPLALMPVLLATEDMPDINHPVFKATVTMSNDNADGIQVYPYVYVRVTEKCWRLNVHEPIIWALMDFYNNLRVNSIPTSSSVTQVDPEIRIDLIDVSEVRLKLSLETAPTERPHGVLGVWSPIFSAIGSAFKIQVHLRKVMHRNRFMRKSSITPAIVNRIKRDLIHNPLHLIFSVDVLGMTKSTLASLSKGFAELSTDGQFLQLRSKQVWSRRITGVSDGILQGTEALAQGVAFGVSGVLRKPVESARQHGLLGLAHGLGRAFLGFFVQPLSGALDFFSLTVDGIGASCARCLEILNNKAIAQRIRNPRAIHADCVIKEYYEREAIGQMTLFLAEASRHIGCTDIFKEPSKYAWSDYYEDHFIVPYQRVVLITNKRVMLLQSFALDKLDKKPCKIIWDVPWEELLALELAKAGYRKPSHLIIHLKNFRRPESFVRLIRCNVEEDEEKEPQAVMICSSIRRLWKKYQSNMKILTLKVPSSQRYVHFSWDETDGRDSYNRIKPMIKPRGFTSISSLSDERRVIKHSVNFHKIWSSEQESRSRCTVFPKQVVDDGAICSIWRPLCPDGYISVGDVAHVGIHPPHVAAIYRVSDANFALPVGYDLVWRNCADDYTAPVTIWIPRPPDGFLAVGCVALAADEEPPLDSAYCVSAAIAEEALFEEQMVWAAPDSYPWACYIYQVQSEALQFVALRQRKEESDWRPMRVSDHQLRHLSEVSGEIRA